MKTIGVIILIVGLLMSIYTGFSYVTKEDVVEIGDLEVTTEEEHEANWSPYLGPGVMVVGVVVLMMGARRK
jgi:hypothetical protein